MVVEWWCWCAGAGVCFLMVCLCLRVRAFVWLLIFANGYHVTAVLLFPATRAVF